MPLSPPCTPASPCGRRAYPALVERAEREASSFHEFLLTLAREEVAHRAETRLRRCVRKARFPLLKTVEEFDFSVQPELRRTLLGSCFSPEFVAQGRNLILTGRSGPAKQCTRFAPCGDGALPVPPAGGANGPTGPSTSPVRTVRRWLCRNG